MKDGYERFGIYINEKDMDLIRRAVIIFKKRSENKVSVSSYIADSAIDAARKELENESI